MSKFYRILVLGVAGLSILTMCLVAFRWEPIAFDSIGFFGWTTAALGIMVTILLGWQIYNVINFRKELKKFSNVERTLKNRVKDMEDRIDKAVLDITMSIIYLSNTQIAEYDIRITGAHTFMQFCKAIALSVKIGDIDKANNLIDLALSQFPPEYTTREELKLSMIKDVQSIPAVDELSRVTELFTRVVRFVTID